MATDMVATVHEDENEKVVATVSTFTGYEPKQVVTGLEDAAVFAPLSIPVTPTLRPMHPRLRRAPARRRISSLIG